MAPCYHGLAWHPAGDLRAAYAARHRHDDYDVYCCMGADHRGVSELGLAFSNKTAPHRVLLALSGFIGILFAIILVLTPLLGAYALVIVLGIYVLVFGLISIFLGLSMGKEKVVVETKTIS